MAKMIVKFTAGQPCEAGRAALEQEMLQLADELDDPFDSDVDEDENETNEVCIDGSPDLELDESDTDSNEQ